VPGNQGVKQIELAADGHGPFYALTAETVAARTYPLARLVTVALDREPGKPIDPKVKEFLRYILSREGQELIARDQAYIPLNARSALQQLASGVTAHTTNHRISSRGWCSLGRRASISISRTCTSTII
jgi:phosphate transport system substrate-binding protein